MIARFTLVVALILTVITAQASDEYVFILRARGNPYWQTVASGINETAKTEKIDAQVFMQANEVGVEEQLDQCDAAVLRRPKAIVLSAVNNSVGIAAMKKAQANGIVVADMDFNITPEEARKAAIDLAFTVGSDNLKIGNQAAKVAIDCAGGKPLKVLILEGAPGSVPGKKRVDGFVEELKKSSSHLVVVGSISAMWDRLQAMTITNDLLQRYPDLGIIYAANDPMALGAAEAVRAAGKSKQVQIIGVDGTADARKAVLEGRLTATVAQFPYLIGKQSVELAVAKVHGEKVAPVQITPTLVLTKEVLEANQDPLLKYIR